MAKRNLFHPEIAQSETDDLYNGTSIPRLTRPVAVTGDGVIKRGTPLASDDGETFSVWGPVETEVDEETVVTLPVIRGILLFDIDTSETEEAANAVLGISGEFNQNKIEDALGEELDAKAIMEAWGRNIHIEANKTYPAVETFPIG
jgi:hypothetical protein